MILSDKTIRSLCVQSDTYFDQQGHSAFWVKGAALPLEIHAANRERQRIHDSFIKPVTQEMRDSFRPMISPFVDGCVRQVSVGGMDEQDSVKRKVLSYGLSSYGYDVRLAETFKIFSNVNSGVIDPKRFDEGSCLIDGVLRTDEDGSKYVILPPNSYLLGHTIETFDIPRDVMVVAVGKSTLARAGIAVNVTPIEPGFKGTVVIEIANQTTLPARIYANEGVAQFLFFRGDQPCETSYADRSGKYQSQVGLTLARV